MTRGRGKPKQDDTTVPSANPDFFEEMLEAVFKGTKEQELADKYAIDRKALRQFKNKPEFQESLKRELRLRVSGLYGMAVNALKRALQDGNIEAIKVVFKSSGLLEQTETKSDTSLTVIMPSGLPEQRIIEVKTEEVKSEDKRTGNQTD